MMRLKFDQSDPQSYRCCICCHVKTGTILLGLWNLLMQLFLIGMLILVSFHPDILQPKQGLTQDTDGIIVAETGRDQGFQAYPSFVKKSLTKEDLCVGYALTVAYLMITVALIYGVVRTRPGYLMPFFCLQVFDFCLNCLTVVGYFTYAPNIKFWIREQGLANFPGMDRVLEMNSDWLMLVFITIFIIILCVKAYLIGVVWACYKYLQMRHASRNMVREYNVDPDTEQMLLPPKYEDAIKMPMDPNMPPPYTAN
ncbi:lysosomal-associated transmembrane protein 4A-like isoform X1 [Haliotis rubra]|uniref:lysosomal-associated transmembrane protein 4A-like isoform X1 n=1 Tax=Haliotis rubra TaxID=36100 RepID=UPI001EE588B5|nr:lysosomal-associated transmembrane protein 4A-like isoform X1 [Haliotis rubra]